MALAVHVVPSGPSDPKATRAWLVVTVEMEIPVFLVEMDRTVSKASLESVCAAHKAFQARLGLGVPLVPQDLRA